MGKRLVDHNKGQSTYQPTGQPSKTNKRFSILWNIIKLLFLPSNKQFIFLVRFAFTFNVISQSIFLRVYLKTWLFYMADVIRPLVEKEAHRQSPWTAGIAFLGLRMK